MWNVLQNRKMLGKMKYHYREFSYMHHLKYSHWNKWIRYVIVSGHLIYILILTSTYKYAPNTHKCISLSNILEIILFISFRPFIVCPSIYGFWLPLWHHHVYSGLVYPMLTISLDCSFLNLYSLTFIIRCGLQILQKVCTLVVRIKYKTRPQHYLNECIVNGEWHTFARFKDN